MVKVKVKVVDHSVVQRPDTEAMDRGAIHDHGPYCHRPTGPACSKHLPEPGDLRNDKGRP